MTLQQLSAPVSLITRYDDGGPEDHEIRPFDLGVDILPLPPIPRPKPKSEPADNVRDASDEWERFIDRFAEASKGEGDPRARRRTIGALRRASRIFPDLAPDAVQEGDLKALWSDRTEGREARRRDAETINGVRQALRRAARLGWFRVRVQKPSEDMVASERLAMIADACDRYVNRPWRSSGRKCRLAMETVKRMLLTADLPLPPVEITARLRDALPFLGGDEEDGDDNGYKGSIVTAFRDPTPSEIRYRMSRVNPGARSGPGSGATPTDFERQVRVYAPGAVAR